MPDAIEVAAAPAALSLEDARLYINRELSQLAFFRRVLDEAQDAHNPLLERVKFLAIVGSNLDEFYMVRVAGLEAADRRGGDRPFGRRCHARRTVRPPSAKPLRA